MRNQKSRHMSLRRYNRMRRAVTEAGGSIAQVSLDLLVDEYGVEPAVADEAVRRVIGNKKRQVRTFRAIFRQAVKLGGVTEAMGKKGLAEGPADDGAKGQADGPAAREAGNGLPLVLSGPGGCYARPYYGNEGDQASRLREMAARGGAQ